MLEVDLHSHTFFSACGIHTHIELLTRAKELGMKGLAITDHGPALSPRFASTFFDRLSEPVPGIRFIKGMECNIINDQGTIDIIDIPSHLRTCIELVLVGFHPNLPNNRSAQDNTDILVLALEKNPCIDIITHPNDPVYPLDFDRAARAAKKYGVALELNNSKTLYQRTTPDLTRALVRACKENGCHMAVNSDTHAIQELGCDSSVLPYLQEESFPGELLVNGVAEKAFAFIEERRRNKQW
jgi:putative hydrolase